MKRVLSLFCFACLFVTGICAQQTVNVQGVPRQLKTAPAKKIAATTDGQSFDPENVRYFVGEGGNTSYLILEWHDGKGAEKLVWGYRYDEATGEKMLRDIAAADPRLYMLAYEGTQYGTSIGGFGFDLNGNQDVSLVKSGTEYVEVDEDGIARTSGYDFDSYTASDSTDHWKAGWYNGYWSYYVADNADSDLGYSNFGAGDRTLSDGSVDYWAYTSFSGESLTDDADYFFYLPEPATGVAIPDELTLPIADNCSIPVVLGATGLSVSTLTWYVLDSNGKTDRTVISSVTSSSSAINGKATFAGDKTGDVLLVMRARINSAYYYSDTCRVTVVAPEKPITSIAFAEAEKEVGIRQTAENEVTLLPADATYTGLTYTSSNESVATVNKTTGVATATVQEGTTTITATSTFDPSISASYELTVKCYQPVESIEVEGGDVITIEERDLCPKPDVTVLPADADYTAVSYTIEDPSIASFYQDNIIAHKAGETNLIIEASDGQGAKATVKLTVVEPDRSQFDGYEDGTFILNEAWYGHENGDMNFLTADDSLMYRVYERENPNEAFGATSCSATIYGGKMFVMSKQAADGGDETTNGGGRLVVLDAKTLKKIAGFETIGGGDGRSVVGVNPHKAYLGTTAGVVTFDIDSMAVGSIIDGTQGASLYSGQTGDMLKAGRYVFAVQQSTGTHVIDIDADTIVTTIHDSSIQGLTQAADGMVWLASSDTIRCVDPETLEVTQALKLPEGSISCTWGSWRPVPFCASRTQNVLYWNTGSDITGGGSEYYRYEIGTDIDGLQPLISLDDEGFEADTEGQSQITYGSPRYDDRDDELIIMTTQSGYGTNYEHNWLHLVDGTTGELKKTIRLKQYYWFQELPVFPDKYAPEFDGVEDNVTFTVGDEAYVIDLTEAVVDQDNIAYNISTTLADSADANIATVVLDGTTLTITPVAAGSTKATLAAESNGVVTEHDIYITVNVSDGISQAQAARAIYARNGQIVVNGYAGWNFILYDMGGRSVAGFVANTDSHCATPAVTTGAYILKGWHGSEAVTIKVAL